ncbi:hypothetical protein [Streptomyces aureus]|uniref:pPIWI_RE_Z domain-containing protein n=1 Tax=Streptomyces aureus TaxID=193461 RepID=UPI00056937B4|nr:hypothetical protein [Streptomyces aureus]
MARDRSGWYRGLGQKLKRAARSNGLGRVDVRLVASVELGLFALESWAAGAAAGDAWALMGGYEFRTREQRAVASSAALRWLVSELKSQSGWGKALRSYQALPEMLRMFDVKDPSRPPERRASLSVVSDREQVYAQALAGLPEHRDLRVAVAEEGVRYRMGRADASVVVPEGVTPAPARRHLVGRRRKQVTLRWSALTATADLMDAQDVRLGLRNNWRGRIDDLYLLVRQSDGRLRKSKKLVLADVMHVVGMPAVGKTTLITVAAVWAGAEPHRRHTLTVVLGDVVAVLDMVTALCRYGVRAAPILGAANRGRHLQQVHRPADVQARGLVLLEDPRLRWISTQCVLQGLAELTEPLALKDAPCGRRLWPWHPENGEQQREAAVDCSLLPVCGRHEAARELVEAAVWVATPASLMHCRVPGQLSRYDMRYLELAWQRSDAFVVDEADRVQIQWDQAFSPSQALAGPGEDAWLDEVRPLFERHMRHTRGQHLFSEPVRDWSVDISTAGLLVTHLRGLLAEHSHVREWLGQGYFNEWRLALGLAGEIAHRPRKQDGAPRREQPALWDSDTECFQRWRAVFSAWLDNPAGRYQGEDASVAFLRDLTARGYQRPNLVTQDLVEWLRGLEDVVLTGEQALERLAVRFQVTMVVALLAEKLALLTRACWEVEMETGLEAMGSSLVHRPPAEYLPLVPDSPMGNLLGFQYREHEGELEQIGTLSFFRCSGIGRWLLLNLPHLYEGAAGEEDPGPACLLLSATSWAGNSPRYDVQVPVAGILASRTGDKVPLHERIMLRYLPVKMPSSSGASFAVRVSGKQGEERLEALRELLAGLCQRQQGLRGPRKSLLEEIRDELPEGRRRVLLLVGSYREAQAVLQHLLRIQPEWADQILQMVPDDESGSHHWSGQTIARGKVHAMARQKDAWILIAPQLAIERGHNILNDAHVAALGAAFYLVRPHLHPEDLGYHVQTMNRWAVEEIRRSVPSAGPDTTLGERAAMFRELARRAWLDLLEGTLQYTATDPGSAQRRAMDWTNIVPLDQIIGRMLRGGATARVYFCDAAFDPGHDDSMLVGMLDALDEALDGPDAAIAGPLYRPLRQSLHTLVEQHRAL